MPELFVSSNLLSDNPLEIYNQINGDEEITPDKMKEENLVQGNEVAMPRNPSSAGRIFMDQSEKGAYERFKGSFKIDEKKHYPGRNHSLSQVTSTDRGSMISKRSKQSKAKKCCDG